MMPLLIALLAGLGLGLVTWYGWALAENLMAVRSRRDSVKPPNPGENE